MDQGSSNKRARLPSFSSIFQNSIRIHSETTIDEDGNLQFYCGLKLTQNATTRPSTSSLPRDRQLNPEQKAGPSTSNYQITRKQNTGASTSSNRITRPDVISEPVQRRYAKKILKKSAFTSKAVPITYNDFGPPSCKCPNRDAIMWYNERSNKAKRARNPSFSQCCQDGKLLLTKFREPPPPLNSLLNYADPATSNFREQIRVYNSMFYFTSFGEKIDHSINSGRAPYTFRASGQNCHLLGSLLPKEGIQPKFAQLYFFDTTNEVRNQVSAFIQNEGGEQIEETIVGSLMAMLNQYSSVAIPFRMARDWYVSHNSPNFQLRLLGQRPTLRQYNAPSVSEVAALITSDFGEGIATRDIIINNKNMGPQRISELHQSYMALQYPMLFPYGEC